MPEDAPKWGSEYKKMLGRYFTRTMSLLGHSTCLAVEQNSVTLDPEVKDAWGLPAMRVTFQSHPDDIATMRFLQARQLEILHAAEAIRTWTPSLMAVEDILPSRHLMGTCRMGNDSKQSVVDRYNRAHDVPNLFMIDGSCFVTSARQQPTCTIQALAFRAAEHMIEQARKGDI